MDFIGIGAPKCGTSKIAQLLAAHPQICLSEPKDIQYFNERATYVQSNPNPNHAKSLDWYMQHFNHCSTNSIKGEFATVYMYCPKAASLIQRTFPKVKLIAAIRQPAERAFSHYLMLRFFQKREARSFEELIKKEPEFIDKGKYAEQLQPFFDLFDPSQIMIVNIENLQQNTSVVTQQLYRFLGVADDFVPSELEAKVNTAKAMRFKWLSVLYGTVMEKMIDYGFANVIHALRKTGIKKIYDRLNYQNLPALPQISDESYNYITQQCLSDIEALEKLLDRDFSHWKKMR